MKLKDMKGMSGSELFNYMEGFGSVGRDEILKSWHKANTAPGIFWLSDDCETGCKTVHELLELGCSDIGDVVESLLYTFPKWEVGPDWNDPEKNYNQKFYEVGANKRIYNYINHVLWNS